MATSSHPPAGIELRRPSTLVERAIHRLIDGPLPTAVIARDVLFLRGNPRAASAAVFALLGSDPRVQVDGQGNWYLAAERPAADLSRLRDQSWVVVDVETTGGAVTRNHRVIEIGMVEVVGNRVCDEYETLINPGRPVPRVITRLTGIDQSMLDPAPQFDQVREEIADRLTGRVFVGHNAGFDWRFVSGEMERSSGHAMVGPRVCTLRLARRLLPQLGSRSLGSLAEFFGIPMERHHRALDDARATAHLLLRLLDMLEEREVHDWDQLRAFLRVRPKRRRRRMIVTSADAA